MPLNATFAIKDIIGKTLFATANITAYYNFPLNKKGFIITKGLPVGVVAGFIYKNTPNNEVYWTFFDKNNNLFYVKADKTKLVMDIVEAAKIPSKEEQAAEIKEDRKAKAKGKLFYYIDKYGKPIATLGGVIVALKLMKDYANKRN